MFTYLLIAPLDACHYNIRARERQACAARYELKLLVWVRALGTDTGISTGQQDCGRKSTHLSTAAPIRPDSPKTSVGCLLRLA